MDVQIPEVSDNTSVCNCFARVKFMQCARVQNDIKCAHSANTQPLGWR